MSESQADTPRNALDLLIEQFLQLYRQGELVTVESFAEQHAEQTEQLLELLPALLALEEVKRDRVSSGSSQARVSLPALERLGDFRIEGELGRGGMGVVFEAVQESLDRRVALKVLPRASLLTGNQLERFRREAQIAARLHHTNIVPVYGSGESDGYHWYAMQYLSGQSLDRWRQTQSELLPDGSGAWRSRARFVARIGLAAAGALHYAHGLGTLHRDIKPGNFLLDQDDHLWVTDFGLAKALESEGLTNSGDLLGTLQYMAPEQFAGIYDVRSEVYALGVTLYELLTLQPAFRAGTRSELMARVREQRIEPLTRVCPEVPIDLAIIVGKAMAREPADRYPDADALQQDLLAFLEDRAIHARRLSALATMWRWCRRNRGVAGLAAGTAAAVFLAAITGWVAYVVTGDALRQATDSGALAKREGVRAESNLRLSLAAFSDVFDALAGHDPALSFDEDPDTGEQTVVVHSPVSARDVVLLRQMLAFYDQFATQNAESQSLLHETARAYRLVGAIHTRLGEPESLLEASTAFEKALQAFAAITDRDVTRDLATVHKDIGHLRERQHRAPDANRSFRRALLLLEQLPDADSSAIRLERAEVLFELSRTSVAPGGRGRGRGGDRSRGVRRAQAMLAELPEDSAQDAKVRALRARLLMEGARHFDGRDGLLKALAIWRELVADHPDRAEYRFQLCEVLLSLAMPRSRRAPSNGFEDRLTLLREADASAEYLFGAQPLFREGRAMLLRVRSRYGRELHLSAQQLDGEAANQRRKLASEILQSALTAGVGLISGDGILDFRYMRQVLETRSWLGLLLVAMEQRELAKAQAQAALTTIEQRVLAMSQRPHGERSMRGERRSPRRGPGQRSVEARPGSDGRRAPEGRPPRGGRRGRERRGGFMRSLDDLIRRIGDDELQARAKALREKFTRRPR